MARGTEEPKLDEGGDLASLADYLKVLGSAKRLHLLRFLVQPHYLEEIASELKMARQTAQEHVQQLLEAGLLQRVRGRRETGPVTDYVVVPQRLFTIQEEFAKLGVLHPDLPDEPVRPLTQPLLSAPATPKQDPLPRLTIVHGLRVGQTVTLSGQGPWLVGRDPHASLCLDYDPFVSQRHAEVRRGGPGFELADLYSSNGTFLDWARLGRGGAAGLEPGAVVRVGKTLLVYRRPGG